MCLFATAAAPDCANVLQVQGCAGVASAREVAEVAAAVATFAGLPTADELPPHNSDAATELSAGHTVPNTLPAPASGHLHSTAATTAAAAPSQQCGASC